MGNVVLQSTHLKLVNEWMLNGGNIKAAAKVAGLSYTQAKVIMQRDDVQQELRRRQHRMIKRNEDKVEELKSRILEEALWSPPDMAGITEDPEEWLRKHTGQKIYGSITIEVIPGNRKGARKRVKVSYKSPSINEIVSLRNQAVEIFGLKKQPEGEGDEYILIQKLNAGRSRVQATGTEED